MPDWQVSAVGHVERFTQALLRGDARVEAREFDLARAEVARTGRPELVARVELTHCAARVASLDFAPCTGFEPLRADAGEAERAYAAITDPLARLVAAGAAMQSGRATPQLLVLASDTAAAQGWRRPLLAWLGVQARLAEQAGQTEEAARIRRRMDLVGPR